MPKNEKTGYTVEREFTSKITTEQFVENIIKSHINQAIEEDEENK